MPIHRYSSSHSSAYRRQSRPLIERLEGRDLPSGGPALDTFGRPPLGFEANQGQADAAAQFLARGIGYTVALLPGAAALGLVSPVGANGTAGGVEVLTMHLDGADPNAAGTGLDRQAGVSNYLIGGDPARWHTGVPHFGRVVYSGVYPGVDVIYHGEEGQLEYDFIVHPGADPRVLALSFTGADGLALDGQGDLVLHTPGGDLVEHAPVLYQDGPGGRGPVAGRFILAGPHRVRFQVDAYDATRPLVIDPTLVYSTYLGGSGADAALVVAVDGGGNTYVTGFTSSTDFPTTPGAFQSAGGGATEYAFVSKLSADGTTLLYSTYLGGNGENRAQGLTVDGTGDAYVAGYTFASDFPTTPGAFQTSVLAANRPHGFVTELGPDGASLVYSSYLGGTSYDYTTAVALGPDQTAYVTGYTMSADFPITPGAFLTSLSQNGDTDAFVTRFNFSGSGLLSSTFLGGNSLDYGYGIAVDSAGNAHVTGMTQSTNFPTTPGAFQTSSGGSYDAFVSVISPDGTALVSSTYLGGGGVDGGLAIALDASGNSYVTGTTYSTNFPTTPGAFQTSVPGGGQGHAFLAEVDGTAALVYSTFLAGNDYDIGEGIAVDASGNAFVTGYTGSTDFPTTADALQPRLAGTYNAFVTELSSDGTALNYSTYLGGSELDEGRAITLDSSGNAVVAGQAYSTDFPTTPGSYQPALAGTANAFVVRLGTNGPVPDLAVAVANSALLPLPPRFVNTGAETQAVLRDSVATSSTPVAINTVPAAAPASARSQALLDAVFSVTEAGGESEDHHTPTRAAILPDPDGALPGNLRLGALPVSLTAVMANLGEDQPSSLVAGVKVD